jgi:Bacterial regulatory helix-turn-helix protein, lysR family
MLEKPVALSKGTLRAFAAVADARSFTRAGVRLGRTQSTISLQIKRSEEQLSWTCHELGK